ncbi:MAG: N-acetylmuramoyl-L-alanine amidase [Pseudohongiellaceae bacterium]
MDRIFPLAVLALFLSFCSSPPYVYIESANQNSRIDYIVIHGTSENFSESLRLLTEETNYPVSSHYLIPTLEDASYPKKSLRVYSLVQEHRRAWHAGRSFWAGETNLNDRSIGIELVNEFECQTGEVPSSPDQVEDLSCDFKPYPNTQITELVALLKNILARYPEIDPIDILGHSDIATMRKSDPGPLFPWRTLYDNGIGAWPDDGSVAKYKAHFTEQLPSILHLQEALLGLGYSLEVSGFFDSETQFAVRAFQLHFRSSNFGGQVDSETAAILWALLEKYRPRILQVLENHSSINSADES